MMSQLNGNVDSSHHNIDREVDLYVTIMVGVVMQQAH